MSAPQSLVQAALNRFVARVGSGLAETAATLAVLAHDAPQRLQDEFNLFWEEVEQEAERLDREQNSSPSSEDKINIQGNPYDLQFQIDSLRAKVAELSKRMEP